MTLVPPDRDPAAEWLSINIDDTLVDASGKATISVDAYSGNVGDAQDIVFSNTATDPITQIEVKKLGGNDGSADVVRFDLSQFKDDFILLLNDENTQDTLVLLGADSTIADGDGTYTVTYTGSDGLSHTLDVRPDTATLETYAGPDGVVDGSDSDETMDVGYTDYAGDQIDGVNPNTIYGNGGADTITGGDGADTIYGDSDAPDGTEDPQPTNPPAGSDEVTFAITDATIDGAGTVNAKISDHVSDITGSEFVTFTDSGTENLNVINISALGGGGGDGAEDVFYFDLSGFDDDFLITIKSDDINDRFVFTNVDSATDNGDGTWTITYTGSDGLSHTVGVTPHLSQVEAYGMDPPINYGDIIYGGGGGDNIDGGWGDDEIHGEDGADTIIGGDGADTISGGIGADTIYGDFTAAVADPSVLDATNDTIDGGDGADFIDGGYGDDVITGGAGNDTITGGDGEVGSTPVSRIAFEWSQVPDPNLDGTPIDDNDPLTSGSQTVSGVTVDYTFSTNVTYVPGGDDASGEVYTAGIDAGAGTVNVNSAASIDGNTSMSMSFSEEVQNVEFRINDLEQSLGNITLRAYDADNNQITINVTGGSNIVGSDTDAVSGDDTFYGTAFSAGDDNDVGSIRVSVPGPVSRVEFDYAANGDSLTMTDVWFDDPATGPVAGGDDTLSGGAGDDIFIAGDGNDTIDGGDGTDSYQVQAGTAVEDNPIEVTVNDAGDGTVIKGDAGTTDTVTSVENFVANEDPSEADVLNYTGILTQWDVGTQIQGLDDTAVGTFNPSGGGGPIAFGGLGEPTLSELLSGTYDPGTGVIPGTGSYSITSGDETGQLGNITFTNFETVNFDVVCFARGTRIETERGEVPVQELEPGDKIRTLDHGFQPLRWIGSTRRPAVGRLAPIRIREGALGNHRTLRVSPLHRMLIDGPYLGCSPGSPEVLVAAKHLINDSTIRPEYGGVVEYFHLLFDQHEIVFAEGAPSESFFPGAQALRLMDEEMRREIFELFPQLETQGPGTYGPMARRSMARIDVRSAPGFPDAEAIGQSQG